VRRKGEVYGNCNNVIGLDPDLKNIGIICDKKSGQSSSSKSKNSKNLDSVAPAPKSILKSNVRPISRKNKRKEQRLKKQNNENNNSRKSSNYDKDLEDADKRLKGIAI